MLRSLYTREYDGSLSFDRDADQEKLEQADLKIIPFLTSKENTSLDVFPGVKHCVALSRNAFNIQSVYLWGESLDPIDKEDENSKKEHLFVNPVEILCFQDPLKMISEVSCGFDHTILLNSLN